MVRRALACAALAGGCTPDPPPATDCVDCAELPLAVMTTASLDYAVGALAAVNRETLEVLPDLATVHGDAVVRAEPGVVWQVNRLGADTVRRYEPGDWAAPVWEVSTGRGSNPQTAVRCGRDLWVSLYETGEVLRLDPGSGERRGAVALDAYADADGNPEVSDLVVLGGALHVGLQRLDRLAGWVSEAGAVAVVDCDTAEVVDLWEVGPNPVIRPLDADRLLVLAEDGLSVLRPADGALEGPLEVDLDGMAVVDAGVHEGVALVVARDAAEHGLWCVDLERWSAAPLGTWTNYLPSVEVDEDGFGWVAVRPGWEDPDAGGGVMRVHLPSCELRTDPWLPMALTPFSVAHP